MEPLVSVYIYQDWILAPAILNLLVAYLLPFKP